MSNVSSPTGFSGLEDRFYDHIDINEKMRVPNDQVSGDLIINIWDNCSTKRGVLENTVMPRDPGMIRVQTPPRVITLNDHYFPTVEDDDDLFDRDSGPTSEKSNSSAQLSHSKIIVPMNQWSSTAAVNESGGNSHKGLLPGEELSHLRSQMAKLNRRLMALELDNLQRQQREKYLLALGLGYFLVKFVIWLNK
ncbi:conserved hypothetical protein [Pediculus humanus corporis]|uniref:Mff-like domain-containing protein n=1 Tax=Pediculus humanus subsp. corporis TaxID=121224 RepID=E0VFT6_PEDHC|nr:uncharacterized protein Phum_PHUM167430 [Pediculus humanus corporis]EEB12242.1 conserved hypothetical protein [Pediculus humanus corporis]